MQIDWMLPRKKKEEPGGLLTEPVSAGLALSPHFVRSSYFPVWLMSRPIIH